MPAKKMRVDVFDEEGNHYTVSFEGKVTRKKALCLLDIVELLGGVHEKQELKENIGYISKFEKTKTLVERHFPFIWFSSKEILTAYEQKYSEPISLSTISTYMARMADRGFLLRSGSSFDRKYRVMTELAQNNLRAGKKQ